MALVSVNISIEQGTVSDVRKRLARVLSKMSGDTEVQHWSFTAVLNAKSPDRRIHDDPK